MASLVDRLRQRDAAAFDEVYDLYRARIFGFLLRMSNNRAVAEDLLQETWIRLAKYAARLRPDTDLRAWLFAVARNVHRSHGRWAAVEQRRREAASAFDREPATPSQLAAASESVRRVEAAIGELAPKYREVVLLVGVEMMTPSEVAAVLGESAQTVRKRLSRARAVLRKDMGE